MNFRQYVNDRDRACIAVVNGESIEVFKAFIKKWQDLGLATPPRPSDEVLEITCRKIVMHINAPKNTRDRARDWLLSRGYDLDLF